MELLVGAVILIGIAGTVVPFLPGPALVGAAVLVYALVERTQAAWVICAICLAILAAGFVLKWLVPAKAMSGKVDRLPLFVGAVLAVVGFFVIPILGLVIGFIVGVFGTELIRTRSLAEAWPATKHALTAAGISLLIDLAAVVVTGAVWLTGVVLY